MEFVWFCLCICMARVKRLSKATENISESALKSIHDLTTGVVRISANNSKAGQKFFKTLPGEMFLVSWESFSTWIPISFYVQNMFSSSSIVMIWFAFVNCRPNYGGCGRGWEGCFDINFYGGNRHCQTQVRADIWRNDRHCWNIVIWSRFKISYD